MEFSETPLPDLMVVRMQPIGDERGWFSRVWCRREFEQQGIDFDIAQVNASFNARAGTVRGMHFQREPHAEGKIVACTAGRVFDVAVDNRPDSPTYLQWYGAELSADNGTMLYVPPGFAHGYQALDDDSKLLYFVSAFYAPDAEGGLRYDDPAIGIEWPTGITEVSDKDSRWPLIGSGQGDSD